MSYVPTEYQRGYNDGWHDGKRQIKWLQDELSVCCELKRTYQEREAQALERLENLHAVLHRIRDATHTSAVVLRGMANDALTMANAPTPNHQGILNSSEKEA